MKEITHNQSYHPLVSVIIPVFNLVEYITPCLTSLLHQTYENMQIIVVNDGSTDDSWSIIEQFAKTDDRIVAINQSNGGAAKARNHGMEHAKGDLIMFVDGDDMLAEDTMGQLVPYFTDERVEWVEFPVIRVDASGKEIEQAKDFEGFKPDRTLYVTSQNCVAYLAKGLLSELSCGCMYRTDFAKGLHFPENEYYEDSFYFTDVICSTTYGIVTTKGEYRYVERTDSSQFSVLDRKRIQSKLNSLTIRIEKLEALENTDKIYLRRIENDAYYFYKTLIAKGNTDAIIPFQNFLRQKKYPIELRWSTEAKILVYKILGYNRIKNVLKKLGK